MNISSLTEFEKPALHPLIQLCKWLGSLTAAFLCSLHTAIIQKRLKKEKKAKRKLQEALEYESKRREQVEQTLKQTSPTESLRSLNGETTYLSNADILQFVKGCIFAIMWIPRYGICNVDKGHFMSNIFDSFAENNRMLQITTKRNLYIGLFIARVYFGIVTR